MTTFTIIACLAGAILAQIIAAGIMLTEGEKEAKHPKNKDLLGAVIWLVSSALALLLAFAAGAQL